MFHKNSEMERIMKKRTKDILLGLLFIFLLVLLRMVYNNASTISILRVQNYNLNMQAGELKELLSSEINFKKNLQKRKRIFNKKEKIAI